MKKKIALVITIAVCIVSVSANVYQYRVIRNKDAQIVWNQTTEDQMFQGILGHIQEEILYLQTCEPDEKDFRIGVAFGYCREDGTSLCTTSHATSLYRRNCTGFVCHVQYEIGNRYIGGGN